MTPIQARKRRYKLNVKIKEGTASMSERAEYARLNTMKGKQGRPRKAAPKPAPVATPEPSPPTETAGQTPPSPEPPPPIEGAAPGIEFSVPGFADAVTDEVKAAPSAPVEPSAAAHQLAGTIVGGLAYLATFIEQAWGFPPLLGMDAVVYPALKLSWATVLEDTGLAGKLGDLANNKHAAQIAVVTSSVYLGGGGLYSMFELKKRAAQAAPPAAADAPPPEPAAEESGRAAPFQDTPKPPPPVDLFARAPRPAANGSGVVQMAVSTVAESKD